MDETSPLVVPVVVEEGEVASMTVVSLVDGMMVEVEEGMEVED